MSTDVSRCLWEGGDYTKEKTCFLLLLSMHYSSCWCLMRLQYGGWTKFCSSWWILDNTAQNGIIKQQICQPVQDFFCPQYVLKLVSPICLEKLCPIAHNRLSFARQHKPIRFAGNRLDATRSHPHLVSEKGNYVPRKSHFLRKIMYTHTNICIYIYIIYNMNILYYIILSYLILFILYYIIYIHIYIYIYTYMHYLILSTRLPLLGH